jgi:hypothetical protein
VVERELGGVAVKLRSPPPGLPDRLVLLPGARVCFIEFKDIGGPDRPAQPVWHALLRRLGFKVFKLVGRTAADEWLKGVRSRVGHV